MRHFLTSDFLKSDGRLLEITSFFKATTPTHDDYRKTTGDIEKRLFAFNYQLKKLNAEIFF